MAKKTDIFYPDRVTNGQFVTAAVKQVLRELEGQQVEVCVRPRRNYTSNLQHRYYRGLVLREIVNEIRAQGQTRPNGSPFTEPYMHELLAHKFLLETVLIDETTGEYMERVKSTTELTAGEMAAYVDAVRKWAFDTFNLEIPDPDPKWKERRLA